MDTPMELVDTNIVTKANDPRIISFVTFFLEIMMVFFTCSLFDGEDVMFSG